MKRARFAPFLIAFAAAVAASGILSERAASDDETPLEQLSEETHFHGIAVDRANPERFFLATHHGLFLVGAEGQARRVSAQRHDFMGFTPHPSDPSVFFASGHPAGGGNLGFIASRDGGRTWRKLSDGVNGPVDFHQMDVSPVEPHVVYGAYGNLQKSTDGGATWTVIGPAPQGLIDLAVSARDSGTLHAATQRGLLRSTDSGRSWAPAHPVTRPATMVHAVGDGRVYAFMVGTGLLLARDEDQQWEIVNAQFGSRYVLHLAAAAGDPARLYAVTFDPESRSQSILSSRDGGRSWHGLIGR